jgi:hypothetical protein
MTSLRVLRQNGFDPDLYPATFIGESALSGDEWASGVDKDQIKGDITKRTENKNTNVQIIKSEAPRAHYYYYERSSEMRVFAPGRSLVTRVSSVYYSLPLEGTWMDVPDYFRQATKNKPVNDVVHAKIVEPVTDQPMSVWDSTLTGGPSSFLGHVVHEVEPLVPDRPSQPRAINRTPWVTTKRVALLEPSPSYKGKNPRVRYGVITDRSMFAWSARVSAATNNPGRPWPRQEHYRILASTTTVEFYILRRGNVPFKWDGARCSAGDVRRYQLKLRSQWLSASEGCLYTWEGPGSSLLDGILTSRDFGPDPTGRDPYGYDEILIQKLINGIQALGTEVYQQLDDLEPTSRPTDWFFCSNSPLPLPTLDLRSQFLLEEPEVVGEGIDPILLGARGGLTGYWRNLSTQHALKAACESLPRLSDNSIQNLTEIASFIKALVIDHRIEIPESLADAWLSYRYQYGTGKMDVEDAIKFVSRRRDLGTLDREISSYGSYSFDYEDTTITCRCNVAVTPKDVGTLKKVWRALDTYGLTPDFYVIWDSIPYSFMVDWFLPISDIASNLDADRMYLSGEYYSFDKLCYSLKYVRVIGDYHCQFYTRWAGSVPSSFNSLYWFDAPSGSAKTWGKRVLDAASIFIGR